MKIVNGRYSYIGKKAQYGTCIGVICGCNKNNTSFVMAVESGGYGLYWNPESFKSNGFNLYSHKKNKKGYWYFNPLNIIK